MPDFRVRVVIDPRGALRNIARVEQGLDRLGQRGSRTNGLLRTALLTHVGQDAIQAVGYITSLADSYTLLGNRIRSSTKSPQEFEKVMAEIPQVAARSRASLNSIAQGFQAFSGATEVMGLTSDTVLRMTETLQKSLVVSGSTTAEAASTMTQYGQALRKGKLDGDEFRSIMENSIVVQRLLANQMGVTTDKLKGLSTEGKITREVMVNALVNGAAEVDAQFAKTMPTLADRWTLFHNQMVITVGQFAQTINLGGLVGVVFEKIAHDIMLATKALGTFIGGIVSLESKLNSLTGGGSRTAMGLVWEVASTAASPLKQLGYLVEGYEELRKASDRLSNSELRERMGAAGYMLVPPYLDKEIDLLAEAREELDLVAKSLEAFKGSSLLGKFGDDVRKRAEDLRNMAMAVNSVTDAISRAQALGAFVQLTGELGEKAVAQEKGLRDMAAAVDSVTAAIERAKVAGAGVTFRQGFLDTVGMAKAILEGKSEDEVRAAAGNNSSLPFIIDALYSGKDTDKKGRGAKDTFPQELSDFLDSINPLRAAEVELAKAEDMLEKGIQRKLITAGAAAIAMERYRKVHEDTLDPLGAFVRTQREEIKLLERRSAHTTEASYTAEAEAMKAIIELKKQGILFSKEQEAATLREYTARVKELEAVRAMHDAQNELEKETNDIAKELGLESGEARAMRQLADIKRRRAAGLVSADFEAREIARIAADKSLDHAQEITSADVYAEKLRRLNQWLTENKASAELRAKKIAELEKKEADKDKSETNRREIQITGWERYYSSISDFDQQVSDLIVNNAQRMEDALVKFFTTGELGMREMVDAMLADLTRLMVRFLIVQAINSFAPGFGSALGAAGGGGASQKATNPLDEIRQTSDAAGSGFAEGQRSSERRAKPVIPKMVIETRVVQDSRGASLAALQSPAAKRIQIANLQSNEVAMRGLQGSRR